MLTAKEAQKLVRKTPSGQHIAEMEGRIKTAALHGKTSVLFYEALERGMVEYLKLNGYKVDESFDRNELLIVVSW